MKQVTVVALIGGFCFAQALNTLGQIPSITQSPWRIINKLKTDSGNAAFYQSTFVRDGVCQRSRVSSLFSNERHEESDGDDAESSKQEAYGNRSFSWTKKYRRLLPYELARKSVMELGLRSKEDWDEYVEDGKVYHGPYLPSRPDEMYADEWVSWDEFLGLMRPFDETRNIVQNVLQIQTMKDYTKFVHDNPRRAEGLRIPAIPNVVYEGKGWVSFDHFFGTME